MKTVKPTIKGLIPSPPIVINAGEGEVFGESDIVQLEVDLDLSGKLPSTVIALLEIINPLVYQFTDDTRRKRFSIQMTMQQMTTLLEFKIKNLSFSENPQYTLDVVVYTWDEATGEATRQSDFANIDVTVVRPKKLKFKKLLR